MGSPPAPVVLRRYPAPSMHYLERVVPSQGSRPRERRPLDRASTKYSSFARLGPPAKLKVEAD